MLKYLVLFILLTSNYPGSLASQPNTAANQPPPSAIFETFRTLTPYTAKYEATWKAGWFPVTIDATRKLIRIEDSWKVSFEAYSSVADLSEISEFTLNESSILPIKYRYKTGGFLSKKLRILEFNRNENKVWLPNNESWGNYTLSNEIQDRLSYQEQIRLDLLNGKTEFKYKVAYKQRLKEYEFKIVNTSKLKTTLGNINVIEIIQVDSDKESNRIWLASDYEYLIVKLKSTSSAGITNTILLKQVEFDKATQ